MSTIPRETAAAAGATTDTGDERQRRGRRVLPIVIGALATIALFVVYLRLARTRAVNSDGSSQALQAWDILHGNVLLHGWILTDVSFYTTEIPEYMLVDLVHGLGAGVVQISAAITYTLAVVLAALLAKGAATGREAAVRVLLAVGIMLAPQLGSGANVLLSSPDHIGTSVPVMLTWLILERSRPRWWVPAVTFVLLAWSMVADELVLLVGVLPLIAVCAVRAGRALLAARRSAAPGAGGIWREPRYEAALAGAAVAAALVATAVPHVLYHVGGFYLKPVRSQLAPLSLITGHNLRLTGEGVLLLGGADFSGLPAGAHKWFVILHLVGVALAVLGVLVTAWRFFRGEDRLPQLLLAGIVINVVAYALGTNAVTLPNTREIAPLLPFAAALAGYQLGPRLLTMRVTARRVAIPVLGLVLAGYVAGLGLELTAPEPPAQNTQLATWLADHPMGTGLSGYWESNAVVLTSGGRASVRAVKLVGGRIAPLPINVKVGWFDPAVSRADFVVLAPDVLGNGGPESRKAVIANFGEPWRVYHVGRYTIMQWRKNLLRDLGPVTNVPWTYGK
ncbi:MAG TPA: hypothetical protein VF060_13795 [Trebonia sp.]